MIPYFNPLRYESLRRNLATTLSHFWPDVLQHVLVAECVVGEANPIAHEFGVSYVRVFSESVLWHKEHLLNLGFMTLQPSELMKPGIVLVLARFFDLLPAGEIRGWRALVPALGLMGVPMLLVMPRTAAMGQLIP